MIGVGVGLDWAISRDCTAVGRVAVQLEAGGVPKSSAVRPTSVLSTFEVLPVGDRLSGRPMAAEVVVAAVEVVGWGDFAVCSCQRRRECVAPPLKSRSVES